MEAPDTMDVSMDQPEKILFTWNSMFNNVHYGETEDNLLGTKGTSSRDQWYGVKFTPEGNENAQSTEVSPPNHSSDRLATEAHMQNFIDCVHSRKEPN